MIPSHSSLQRNAARQHLPHKCQNLLSPQSSSSRRLRLVCTILILFVGFLPTTSWRQYTTWSSRQWCEQVVAPYWPYAYNKDAGISGGILSSSSAVYENKGRIASNEQAMGHVCGIRGARSICHRCEPIACGADLSSTCQYQLQGVDYLELPRNIPTTSDSPFAVGPLVTHRNDFGVAERVCVILSGDECIRGDKVGSDYSACALRCWGASSASASVSSSLTPPIPTRNGWTYNPAIGLPQGKVFTVAGQAKAPAGFADGSGSNARFSNPQGVAVDADRNIYVADTKNHAIRKISAATGFVSTITGINGIAGFRDGHVSRAQFSHPVGITVFEDCVHFIGTCERTLLIADTANHRIRRIVLSTGEVTTIAGGGNTTESEMEAQAHGLADGYATFARFNTPMGITCDAGGNIFVADTRNHVIRWIDPSGQVMTLAGKVIRAVREMPGCRFPCKQGVAGHLDANVTESLFYSPYSVAIGPGNPYTLLVVDGDRVRSIGRKGQEPFADSPDIGGPGFAVSATATEIMSLNMVDTLAGSSEDGQQDGRGFEAHLDKPRGITMAHDGRVYMTDSSRCRLRSLTVAKQSARHLTCSHRLVDILRPNGCASYDPPVDGVDRTVTEVYSHTFYNYNLTDQTNAKNFSSLSVADDATTLGDGYVKGYGIDGRRIPSCLGTPPWDVGKTSTGRTKGATNGTISVEFDVDEDTGHGTTYLVWCPPGCGDVSLSASSMSASAFPQVYGTENYGDESSVCRAALHAGVATDASGGLVTVTLRKGVGALAGVLSRSPGGTLIGSLGQGQITSLTSAAGAERTFTVEVHELPLYSMEVETLAGIPAAPLDASCGYTDGQPPQATRFNGPSGLALYVNATLTDSEVLVIADSHNNVIRAVTAVCSQTCENGGKCVAPQTCSCSTGWKGMDCTIPICSSSACGPRQLCTAPDTCTCIPGFGGFPQCATPLCVQTCENGGTCSAPDTCGCANGWFDSNCTTPVCSQTCGNGANCTAPDTCVCPKMWQGNDCRIPVCTQTCLNGGFCSAPDTCTCTPSWSGHDCSKPVCHQGFFRPDPYPAGSAPPVANPVASYGINGGSVWRTPFWLQFEPCAYDEWCTATDEFECRQLYRHVRDTILPPIRAYSGKATSSSQYEEEDYASQAQSKGNNGILFESGGRWKCFPIELGLIDPVPYVMEDESGNETSYARFTKITPYGWGPTPTTNPWSAAAATESDRQVALVSYKNVTQGVYVCANGGNCTAPDTCVCAPGWIGYDCRIPVCRQGFYYPTFPDVRYPGQGLYLGSPRGLTIWENPATPNEKFIEYVHDHPNFHSIPYDMDAQLGFDETHTFNPGPASQQPPEYNVYEGWRLYGWWIRNTDQKWQHGKFSSTYDRTCKLDSSKEIDLRTYIQGAPVDDTYEAFHPRMNYSSTKVDSEGRWYETGGECIDEVILGCFNSGVCISPNTCKCAPGWEGDDCSLPICYQTESEVINATGTNTGDLGDIPLTLLRGNGVNYGTEEGNPPLPGDQHIAWRKCPNNGNCTHPDTCTCEKGWSGADCMTPMCVQECFHNGKCTAPDTCTCSQTPSIFLDARGVPLFQKPDGDAQDSGWTGFDCNTPVCVQAEQWVLNDDTGARLVSLLKDSGRPLTNDGTVFQGGCSAGGDYIPVDSRTRISDTLCGQAAWYIGIFEEPWANDEKTSRRSSGRSVRVNHPNYYRDEMGLRFVQGEEMAGEGMYACYNNGACTAPDTCLCADGWSGFDCNVPVCEYTDGYGNRIVGCSHGGVCSDVNYCSCPTTTSLLYLLHDEPQGAVVGWTAKDCTMAICVQGFFDPDCRGVPPGVGGVSSMFQGCYRCPNGGNCTAPDVCTCPAAWTGYDCRTPVCVQHATRAIIADLQTLDEAVIEEFEYDPCGSGMMEEFNGMKVGRGNCTRPNTCTCLCKKRGYKDSFGVYNDVPWQDPLNRKLPAGYIFGRFDCIDGFEGNLNPDGTFSTCHLRIYVPTWIERYSLIVVVISLVVFFAVVVAYIVLRRQLRRRFLQIKADRRRQRRMQEEQEKAEAEAEKTKKKRKKRGGALSN